MDPSKDSQKPQTTDDESDLPSPWNPLPYIKQALRFLGCTLASLKTPLYFALYYTMFYGFLTLVAIFLTGLLLTAAKMTACGPPILSRALPFCGVPISPNSNVEFENLGKLQFMLEEIQEASAGGVTLPLLMKRGENAVREVALNVELSNLPSKKAIGETLREFQRRAHKAGDDFRSLNSHIDRTMDSIISTNQWTARALGEIAREEEIENSSGAVTLFVNKGIALFDGPKPCTEEAVKLQYVRHLSQVKDDIDVLITEAGLSVMNLEALENLLFGVNYLGKQDVKDILKSKVKASKKLSAYFGLNWEEMDGLEEQSQVIMELLQQKNVALARVTGTLEHLRDISAGLGDLRERVTIPGRPQAQRVPLLVQIDTIHRGLERLERGRERTRQKKDTYLKEIRDQIH